MTEAGTGKETQWRKLVDAILGYQATWIADVGLKAGLFRAVAEAGDAGISEEELAARLGYAPRYVQVWCRGAYAFEMLDWDERQVYRLAPHMAALLLNPEDPQFLGGRLQFTAALFEDFRAFPEYLRRGTTWPRSEHDPWLIEALANMTKPDVAVFVDTVLPQAPGTLARLEHGGTILDLGAGTGYAAAYLARRFPRARVAAYEVDPASVALARQTVRESGLAERVDIREMDANELDEENAYDLVTMNVALHETGGPDAWRNVLSRVYRALRPRGTVLVSELPYPDSIRAYRQEPVYKILAGVQFHESLVGCGQITPSVLRQLLLDTGFARVRVAQQPISTRQMMLGEKPAPGS